MNFFKMLKLLKSMPLIMRVLKDYQMILEALIHSEHKIPSVDQVKIMLDDVRLILDSGLIDIPGIDESELSKAILEIENTIGQASLVAAQNLVKFGEVRPSVSLQKDETA